MVSEIKKGVRIQPNPDLITLESTVGNILAKKDGKPVASAESQTKSDGSSSLAAEARGTLNMQATLRRFIVDQDLNNPDMAAKAYQHNQTDLEFLKSKESKK